MEQTIVFDYEYPLDEMSVEKEAKIFEAGEYPDKEITVTENDLDAIVGNFTEAPVKVEHTDSPLDPIGTVKAVWRNGRDLFARLAFPKDLAGFLERRGVKKLSVALWKDPLRLAEVSLVLAPRVPSAAMFGEQSAISNQQSANPQFGEGVIAKMTDQEKEIQELRFALRAKDVDAKLVDLKAQGKIVPAAEAFARELLLRGDSMVTFGDEEVSIAGLFERFLLSQPKVVSFHEMAPASEDMEGGPLSPEEQRLLSRLGVSREQMQKYEKLSV